MKPTSLLAKFWIDFFADDPADLPAWVHRAVKGDAELTRLLRQRCELESDLRSQSDAWCESAQPNEAQATGGISSKRFDEILATETSGQSPNSLVSGLDEIQLEPSGAHRSRTGYWGTFAVAAVIVLSLSLWFSGALNSSNGKVELAQGETIQDPSGVQQVDFKPILATAAASQRMAVAVKDCSVSFLSRVADVTNSDALALPLAESAAMMNETAVQWKESPKKFGLAVARLLGSEQIADSQTQPDSVEQSNAP